MSSNHHRNLYKNNGRDKKYVRDRLEEGVRLRRQNRTEILNKRRQIADEQAKIIEKESQQKLSIQAGLEEPLQGLLTGDISIKLECLKKIRKYVTYVTGDMPLQYLHQLLAHISDCIEDEFNPDFQEEALWILSNVAAGSAKQSKILADAGFVPQLINLLMVTSEEVQEIAIWALANICADSPANSLLLLKSDLVELLLIIMMNNDALALLNVGVWCFSNIVRNIDVAAAFDRLVPCLPVLTRLMFIEAFESLDMTLAALLCLSKTQAGIEAIVEDETLCMRLSDLMKNEEEKIAIMALRVVGNLLTGNHEQTQAILNCNILPRMVTFLSMENVQQDVCWMISNIAAGTTLQIESLIIANIFAILKQMLDSAPYETQKEALWCFHNAVFGGAACQIFHFVEDLHLLPSLIKLLEKPDVGVNLTTLRTIKGILDCAEAHYQQTPNPYALLLEDIGGLDRIEQLQYHPNADIYSEVMAIIVEYFNDDEIDYIDE